MKYIFLHGMGQRASSWDKTISFLPDTAEAVCPELSDLLSGSSCDYNNMYASFCEYCSGFSGIPALCGLSLGAVLALNYAVDHLHKVKSLILIAPQFDMIDTLYQLYHGYWQTDRFFSLFYIIRGCFENVRKTLCCGYAYRQSRRYDVQGSPYSFRYRFYLCGRYKSNCEAA